MEPMSQIWGHRGASAYAPENTIPALMLAADQGADGVEVDVQRTLDGHLVLVHDDNISRTSNGFGRVCELTLEQLKFCEFSNGFVGFRNVRIPTLTEALQALAETSLEINLELKNTIEPYPGLEHEVANAVEAAGLIDRVVISSFNHQSLANLRGRVGQRHIGVLYSESLFEPWNYAKTLGAGALHPSRSLLNQPGYVDAAHEAGLKVNTWTIDSSRDFKQVSALGVDAVITNMPDKLRTTWR